MTAPRQVLPGTTSLITRRCSERRFFLRPTAVTNEIFLYVLAVAAKRYNVPADPTESTAARTMGRHADGFIERAPAKRA